MKKNQPSINILMLALIVAGVVAAFLIVNLFNQKAQKTEKDLEAESSEEAIQQGNDERAKYPLLEKLPVKNALYSIGYSFGNDEPIITINTSETYLDAAIKELNSFNADNSIIASYNIIIKGLSTENVFKKESASAANSSIQDPKEFLRKTFENVGVEFKIDRTEELENYTAAIITTGSEETYNLVKYRTVLKNENGWSIVAYPELILTTTNAPSVEAAILQKINEL